MNGEHVLRLTALEVLAEPFPYFTAFEGFSEETGSTILNWLETDAPWKLVETDFYEQFEFSLSGVRTPPSLRFISGLSFLDNLRRRLERVFRVALGERIDCTAHKLIRGQRIRIHNDFIPGGETHRVLVQLNRGWHEDQGGFLMLFNSQDSSDLHRVLPPIPNSVVGFAISERSNHAVSATRGGERFTLVYSFYASDST